MGCCCRSTTSGIRASQVALGIFLAIRRALRADSVEIVCRSQISGSLVRGIVCRPQNNTRSAQGIIGGVDPVQKLNLGFREEGKKSDFYRSCDLFSVDFFRIDRGSSTLDGRRKYFG